jgi:SagB-type dehydrogenase family enzyme
MFEVSIRIKISTRRRQEFLSLLPPPMKDLSRRVLGQISGRSKTIAVLEHTILDGDYSLHPIFWHVMELLSKVGAIEIVVAYNKRRMMLVRGAVPMLLPPSMFNKVGLSRFAVFRPFEQHLMIETPFSSGHVALVSDEASILCSRLARGLPTCDARSLGLSRVDERTLIEMLTSLDCIGALDRSDSPKRDSLVQWEPHDAIFHARTRGRNQTPRGGTYRFLGKRSPMPAVPKRLYGDPIALPENGGRPDLLGLAELLSRRRSVRSYGRRPMRLEDLVIFLRNVSRIEVITPVDPLAGRHYETVQRVYPGGGACHELELYPIVHRCDGLARGVYCYDGASDQLRLVTKSGPAFEHLLSRAGQSMGIAPNMPDVLLCIAARFGRVNWKYEGIAYATILKNVGVLFGTMYLVATAMGLAPCAIGAGDSADFTEVTCNDPFEEDTVGEFALGSSPCP